MRKQPFRIDISGATALEFALCAPAFFMLVMGIVQLGLLVWMQLALQQGVEAAARCASINKNTCASASQIQSYASAQSYGLSPPDSAFTVTTPACGNMVQASYTPSYLPSFPIPTRTLTAQACFPA
ncbi:MAG TPA: TadE/TadG family type IV pilus assembly protein [Rhizomicrobium sp.]|jgi:Flp pilus assembly protein TadG|nr:TadE/TadG family type IV pilus assembly protein [Rhizomicrobium sp.]